MLFLGAKGSGKRCAAAWLARRRLQISPTAAQPEYPLQIPEHADLRWLKPPEDKHAVGIDQIRELVRGLSLTSYSGGGKVAVIDPANAMTSSAANSLLKTLEEPSGDALLILVADGVGRLPATILSRCQRIKFSLPSEADGLRWLNRLQIASAWPQALREAGNAPLAAVEALQRLDDTAAMAREFADLPARQAAPLEVAARWAKYEPEFVLAWLSRQIQNCILQLVGLSNTVSGVMVRDSVLHRIDRRNLFCYLDIINRLRSQPAGSFNVQLTFESLLIDWAEGLKHCRNRG